ncbi:MAG: 50S ribosomal protein L4 [Candidatus Omnitrophica bacterium]|nr:50S ribosomal protein L4 [Candidatus Omnitrophota bacterium]MDD5429161.1 50S ribosomal protein L4 [Candidatus Omnitrophota bacterium]
MVEKKAKEKSKKSPSLTLSVLNDKGKAVEKINLDKEVFDGKVSLALIHQAVVAYQANQRKGLASTKTKGEVSGGGRKPWRQKGTGRARFGSSRNPVWRGGGTAFGPKPHSFYKELPRKMKTLALKSALNEKLNTSSIVVMDEINLKTHKTKGFVEIVNNIKLDGKKTRFVVENLENNIKIASRNIKKALLIKANDICTVEAVDCEYLVFTKGALRVAEERIKKCL